jgi:hypothetical protein
MKNFSNAQHDTILESTVAIVDLAENCRFQRPVKHPADRRPSSNLCAFVC